MKCSYCQKEFPDPELQLSHDVPKYIGGTDSDGRHYLCKKHHDIYEKTVFSAMAKGLPPPVKDLMIKNAKKFAASFFKRGEANAK